jgi:predicted metal-dependent peptidase
MEEAQLVIPVTPVQAVERQISASLLRLRRKAPFFATLALYARFVSSSEIPTAATDGKDVFYNPEFLGALTPAHLDGVLLHEVLHAALGHVPRRGQRDPQQWNVAADIVVNGILTKNGFELPEGALLDSQLDRFSAEEVFALLQRQEEKSKLPEGGDDLLEGPPSDADGSAGDSPGAGGPTKKSRKPRTDAERKALEEHWRRAVAEAAAIGRTTEAGSLPLGIERAFDMADQPKLNWRTVLWRFLTPTPTDFGGFDRRHLSRGLYLETLESESLNIIICVDTSGSIDNEMIAQLLAEVDAILRSYPGLHCWLYYADADVYGPYRLEAGAPTPTPEGGGGTDFRPFFAAAAELESEFGGGQVVGVYMTDGYGDFPTEAPSWPVLWAVTPGGQADELFPFGTAVRLAE